MNDIVAEVSAEIAADVAQRKARYGIGYAVVECELFGRVREFEVTTDFAPAEPVNDYPGYLHVVSVKLNGIELIDALDKDDLNAIKESI